MRIQVIECDTFAQGEDLGMNHPAGCSFVGQTPVRYDNGRKVGGGIWVKAAPVKSYEGGNFVCLKVEGQTPKEGVLLDCKLFKKHGWEQQLGVNWSDEGRFPIQNIWAVSDEDHDFQITIVMDLDNGTDRFHHSCSFLTPYKG